MKRSLRLSACACLALLIASALPVIAAQNESPLSDRQREGAALYAEHCAHCHRPLAKTSKPDRSVKRLRSSIEHFPAMNYLDFLSDTQLEALAEALRSPSSRR